MEFNQDEFKQWFIKNAPLIFSLTGISHYDSANAGIIKYIYLLELRITTLENQCKESV